MGNLCTGWPLSHSFPSTPLLEESVMRGDLPRNCLIGDPDTKNDGDSAIDHAPRPRPNRMRGVESTERDRAPQCRDSRSGSFPKAIGVATALKGQNAPPYVL